MAAEVSPDFIREWYTKDLTLEQQRIFLETVEHGILGDHREIEDEFSLAWNYELRKALLLAEQTPDKVSVRFPGVPEKTAKLLRALSKNTDGEEFLSIFLALVKNYQARVARIARRATNAAEDSGHPYPLWKISVFDRYRQILGEWILLISDILAGFDARRKQATEEEDRQLEARRLAEMRKRVAAAPPTDGSPALKRARTAAAALEVTQGDVAAAARLLLLF